MAGSSGYLKNCLILQQVRLMNVQSLLSFCELLQANDSHKCIGTILMQGISNFAIFYWVIILFVYMLTDSIKLHVLFW